MAESRFLKFKQFHPGYIEPRFCSIRSDTITYFFTKRSGDLFCIEIGSGSTSFEVMETYEEVERVILEAEVKDRMGT